MVSGTSTPPAADAGYVPALDGVRAIAILLVLCVHADAVLEPGAAGHAMMRVLGYGWTGVDLFFSLSGMLITGILLDTKGASGYYASFYARRTLRIFPLYYAALFLLLIALPIAGAALHHHPPHFFPHQGWLWTYTANIGMAKYDSWHAATTGLTFPFWSLAVEEQFYLVWPFVVASLSACALARVAGAMMVVALLLRTGLVLRGGHTTAVYCSTLTRMDALAAGALVALAVRAPGGLARYRRYAAPLLFGVGGGLAVLFSITGETGHDPALIATGGYTLLAVGSAAFLVLVLTAAPGGRLRRALEWRPARHLGARSYGVYVWHLSAYSAASALVLPRITPFVPWPVVRNGIAFVAALAATLAMAEVSWRVLEAPVLALKRFVPRPGRRAAEPGVPAQSLAPEGAAVAVPVRAA